MIPTAGETDQLTSAEVAALAGITTDSFYRARMRGSAPEPDGMLGATPWWRPETITEWLATRRGPGRPSGRKS